VGREAASVNSRLVAGRSDLLLLQKLLQRLYFGREVQDLPFQPLEPLTVRDDFGREILVLDAGHIDGIAGEISRSTSVGHRRGLATRVGITRLSDESSEKRFVAGRQSGLCTDRRFTAARPQLIRLLVAHRTPVRADRL
jgi:hypothetical protein